MHPDRVEAMMKKSSRPSLARIKISRSPKNITKGIRPRRPVISDPIGPVKNSRGPDLIRSETFSIVDGIKDCTSESSASETMVATPTRMTRRISASFNNGEPLAASPTVASSDVTVTMPIQATSTQTPLTQLRKASLGSTFRKPNFKSGSTVTLLQSLSSMYQNENDPPAADRPRESAPPPPKLVSKLPKSRTLNVLYGIKSSISRPSLASRSVNLETPIATSSPRVPKVSSSSNMSNKTFSTSSQTRPDISPASVSCSSESSTLEYQPKEIRVAQTSSYWAGRFVSLHDRYLSEELSQQFEDFSKSHRDNSYSGSQNSTHAAVAPRFSYARPTHLSQSTTTSALTNVGSTPAHHAGISQDDAHHLRIFKHLDTLCTTPEAKRSLFHWQQSYARIHRRANILPYGGTMEDRGIVAKLFGSGSSRKRERNSLAAPYLLPNDQDLRARFSNRRVATSNIHPRI